MKNEVRGNEVKSEEGSSVKECPSEPEYVSPPFTFDESQNSSCPENDENHKASPRSRAHELLHPSQPSFLPTSKPSFLSQSFPFSECISLSSTQAKPLPRRDCRYSTPQPSAPHFFRRQSPRDGPNSRASPPPKYGFPSGYFGHTYGRPWYGARLETQYGTQSRPQHVILPPPQYGAQLETRYGTRPRSHSHRGMCTSFILSWNSPVYLVCGALVAL